MSAQNHVPNISQTQSKVSIADVLNGEINNIIEDLEPEEIVVDVECIDSKGITHTGGFIIRIPTNDQLLEIERRKVLLAGGHPLSLFQLGALEAFNDIATCAVMFHKGSNPEQAAPAPHWWYDNWNDLPIGLFTGLAGHVRDHSDRYFRADARQGEGAKGRGYVSLVRQGVKGILNPEGSVVGK